MLLAVLLVSGALLGSLDAVGDGLRQVGGRRLVGTGVLGECFDQRLLVLAGGAAQLASRGHDGLGFGAVLVGAVRPQDEHVIGGRDGGPSSVDRVRGDLCVTVLGDDALQPLGHSYSLDRRYRHIVYVYT